MVFRTLHTTNYSAFQIPLAWISVSALQEEFPNQKLETKKQRKEEEKKIQTALFKVSKPLKSVSFNYNLPKTIKSTSFSKNGLHVQGGKKIK